MSKGLTLCFAACVNLFEELLILSKSLRFSISYSYSGKFRTLKLKGTKKLYMNMPAPKRIVAFGTTHI